MVGQTQMTLSEGMENIQQPPFLVDAKSGVVSLNFDPQKGMKGYFDFKVSNSGKKKKNRYMH